MGQNGEVAPDVEAALSDASRALLDMIDRARQQALELLLDAERDAAAIRAAAAAEAEQHLDGVAQVIEDTRRQLDDELHATEGTGAGHELDLVNASD